MTSATFLENVQGASEADDDAEHIQGRILVPVRTRHHDREVHEDGVVDPALVADLAVTAQEADVAIEEDERDLREAIRVREVETGEDRDAVDLRRVVVGNARKEVAPSPDQKIAREVTAPEEGPEANRKV